MWPEVKKEVPEAELHIFYGWQLFDQFYSNNPASMMWKKKIEDLILLGTIENLPGVKNHINNVWCIIII